MTDFQVGLLGMSLNKAGGSRTLVFSGPKGAKPSPPPPFSRFADPVPPLLLPFRLLQRLHCLPHGLDRALLVRNSIQAQGMNANIFLVC